MNARSKTDFSYTSALVALGAVLLVMGALLAAQYWFFQMKRTHNVLPLPEPTEVPKKVSGALGRQEDISLERYAALFVRRDNRHQIRPSTYAYPLAGEALEKDLTPPGVAAVSQVSISGNRAFFIAHLPNGDDRVGLDFDFSDLDLTDARLLTVAFPERFRFRHSFRYHAPTNSVLFSAYVADTNEVNDLQNWRIVKLDLASGTFTELATGVFPVWINDEVFAFVAPRALALYHMPTGKTQPIFTAPAAFTLANALSGTSQLLALTIPQQQRLLLFTFKQKGEFPVFSLSRTLYKTAINPTVSTDGRLLLFWEPKSWQDFLADPQKTAIYIRAFDLASGRYRSYPHADEDISKTTDVRSFYIYDVYYR